MSKNVNLGAIMRHCAKKQESAFLNLKDFCDYLKKYSARHLENHPELVQYLEISEASLLKELEDYAARHEIYILHQFNSKVVIIVLTYYSAYFAEIYKEIIRALCDVNKIISYIQFNSSKYGEGLKTSNPIHA